MRPLVPLALACAAAACTVHGSDTCGSATARPSARDGATAVLVPTTNQVYLYGGETATSADAGDLWRYSFAAGCSGWAPIATDTHPTGIGADYAAAFDSTRQRILYVSLADASVWALDTDGLKWSKLLPTLGNTVTRVGFSAPVGAVYDAEHDRLLVGNLQLRFAASDQGQWQALPVADPARPPSLTVASALDPVRRAVYSLDDSGALRLYTLLTDAQQPVTLAGDPIGPVAGARLAWDDAQNRVALLAPGDLYAFSASDGLGANVTVTHLAPSGAAPPARSGPAFAITGSYGLVFGGRTTAGCMLDDSWLLVGEKQWTAQAVATTCP
jgi:hypothetical protein